MRTVTLPDGTVLPALGQGTWRMGEGGNDAAEAATLRAGIERGLTVIDTAEMYADGGAERVVGAAIDGLERERVFLVSKVLPSNASSRAMPRACEASLRRLGVERLDLYLLHWSGSVPLEETVEAFEHLREAGRIARWGVSNLDLDEMRGLPGYCATNQILYNLEHRGAEFDLLPWMAGRAMPAMAYSPVGQGGSLLRHEVLERVARERGASPAQVALAWTLRGAGILAIPKASRLEHFALNIEAAELALDADACAALDAAFAPPRRKHRLEML